MMPGMACLEFVCFVYFWGAFVAMYAGYDKCVMMDVMKRCKDGLGIL